jgi:4-carboxymuconolactone decarboxylase
MRTYPERIAPLDGDAWNGVDDDLRAKMLSSGDQPLNIFATLAHHPGLLRRWMVFATHVLSKNSLPPRERELVILRIGWLCESLYEWTQHVAIGERCGLDAAEIDAIAVGPGDPRWGADDRWLLVAVDDLHRDARIGDPAWSALSNRYSTEQLIDIVFTVGQYNLVSMALNTLGVQVES